MDDETRQINGLTDSSTVDRIQEIQEALSDFVKEYNRYYEQILEKSKKLDQIGKSANPYADAINKAREEQEKLTTDVGNYQDVYEKRLAIDKWYAQEYSKLKQNIANLSANEQTEAKMSLNVLYAQRSAQAEEEVWQQRGEKIADIFGDGLGKIVKNYDNFGGQMKDIASDIANYLIQESARALLQQVFQTQKMQGIVGALDTTSKGGSWLGAGASIIKGVGKAFGIFHSGGVVPVGANAQLPGTQEQLALLKGGERILSPSENVSYKDNQGGASPVVFNNFNIKAWDSKDVRKYLTENRELLNQITFEGIKNNYCQLRNMVRGA